MSLITLEGIEGSGKSTQARRLAAATGGNVLLTFEPGATTLGAGARDLLLEHGKGAVAPEAELLLFLADRVQHMNEVITPALAAGRVVICDRFADSTMAYQGYGRGIPRERIRALSRDLFGELRPDITLLFDVSVETGLTRVGRRGAGDRIESERRAFHERVRAGYRELAAQEPSRWVTIDAEPDSERVWEQVQGAMRARGWLADAVR